MSDWPDDFRPHDPAHCLAQERGLLKLLQSSRAGSNRIVDLGCGDGRMVIPLMAAGHRVMGIDRDAAALRRCASALLQANGQAELIKADYLKRSFRVPRCDAVICLGNTFMQVADVDDAVALLTRVRRALRPGGFFAIDDIPHDLWPELTDGNWINGISADGSMQMVWKPGDSVFALRRGRKIDRRSSSVLLPKRGEQLLRLWCEGSLKLLAAEAGLSAPERLPSARLIVMRRRNRRPASI